MAEARGFAAHPCEWRLLGPAYAASCLFGPSLALRRGGVFPIVSRCLPRECLWFGSPCVQSAFSSRASPCQPGILVAKAESNGRHLPRWVFSCQCGGAAPLTAEAWGLPPRRFSVMRFRVERGPRVGSRLLFRVGGRS